MRASPLIVIMILLLSGMGSRAQDDAGRLTIFAATSLTDVFEALRDAFLADNPQAEILLNFSSSSTLAAQLMQGAPADIFASANEAQMDLVVETGLIAAESVEIFAHNQLVVIAPAANPAEIGAVQDLANDSLLLVLAAPGTPIRAYSDAMLRSYADDYGDGFFERVIANLVSEESNVRQVVTRVALGEADAGIVYQSDAIGGVSADLHIIPVDSAHNQLAAYPIAPMSSAADPLLAQRFIDFALSEAAQPIFDAYGFCTPAILGGLPDDATPEPALEADDSAETPPASCPEPKAAGD